MHFSEKYKPLLAKPHARDLINSDEFDSLTEGEKEFWLKLDKVSNFILTGGRGSGKSKVVEVDAHIRGAEHNHKTYYARYTNDSLESTVISDFENVLDDIPLECNFLSNKIDYPDSGQILFKELKRGSKAQTAGGKGLSTFNCLVVEEAEEHPSLKEYDKMKLSLRRTDLPNYGVLLLNPTTKDHWIYKAFFEDRGIRGGTNAIIGDTCYIHTTYLDVPKEFHTEENWDAYEKGRKAHEYYKSLSTEGKENCTKEIKNLYEWYEYIVLGGWRLKAEGVVF